MGWSFGGYVFALVRATASATLLLTCTSVIAADEHGAARSPEPQTDSNRELIFEQFAKDYRCPEWFGDAEFGLWLYGAYRTR